ncbi:MAG: RDD family protein [Bacilli bacterium]
MDNKFLNKEFEEKKTKPVGFGKSIMAYIIDMALTIIGICLIFAAVSSPIYQANNGSTTYNNGSSFLLDSQLVYKNDDGFKTYGQIEATYEEDGITKYGYQTLEEKVWYYYTTFLLEDSRTEFNELTVEHTKENATTWVLANLYGISDGTNTSDYYDPALVDGKYSYTTRPVLKDKYQTLVDNKDETTLSSLLTYFANDDGGGLYFIAFNHMSDQTYYINCQEQLDKIQYLALLPAYLIAPLLFFIIIPLLVPNGKTIGKLIFGLAVTTNKFTKAKKWQIFVHYLLVYFWWLFLLMPNMTIGIILAVFFMVMDYLFRIIRQDKKCIHDLLAKTVVIDSRKYKIFNTEEEYNTYLKGVNYTADDDKKSWEDKYSKKINNDDKSQDASSLVIDIDTLKKHKEEKDNRNK